MKICATGAQGVGKTTLINALHKHFPDFKIQSESVRYIIKKYGFDIHSAEAEFQMALLNWQTKDVLSEGNMFLDRSFIDSLSYTKYYFDKGESTLSKAGMDYIYDMSKEYTKKYMDFILFIRPEFKLVPDGVRIVDNTQQLEVDKIMENLIKEFKVDYKVFSPTGSVKNRVLEVEKEFSKLGINPSLNQNETF